MRVDICEWGPITEATVIFLLCCFATFVIVLAIIGATCVFGKGCEELEPPKKKRRK